MSCSCPSTACTSSCNSQRNSLLLWDRVCRQPPRPRGHLPPGPPGPRAFTPPAPPAPPPPLPSRLHRRRRHQRPSRCSVSWRRPGPAPSPPIGCAGARHAPSSQPRERRGPAHAGSRRTPRRCELWLQHPQRFTRQGARRLFVPPPPRL